MANRVNVSTLEASTMDIINTIRMNCNPEYQSLVPAVTKINDIPAVGEVLYGYPAMANQFLTQLINRIALVLVKSSTFNNPYAELKKGYLDFGETVEEIFVEMAKVREFSVEKAPAREFARTLPDVRSAFHVMNWSVQYPITVQRKDLRKAFLSANGVYDMVARIIDSVYRANNYDEFLLFKYLIIKGITNGTVKPVMLTADTTAAAAVGFRGYSNLMTFNKTDFNQSGVHASTPRNDQFVFMDSMYNAKFDVEQLSSAFNMDKTDFMGHLLLMDDWNSFDNVRFQVIRENSNMIEEVTAAELASLANLRAAVFDREWFQVYDNSIIFDDKKVAAGTYWNYFLNVEKTISYSPFANAIAFFAPAAAITAPEEITVEITGRSISPEATVLTLQASQEEGIYSDSYQFVQTEELTEAGIGVHPYGAVLIPASQSATSMNLELLLNGTTYYAQTAVTSASTVGTSISFKTTEPEEPENPDEPQGNVTTKAAKAKVTS